MKGGVEKGKTGKKIAPWKDQQEESASPEWESELRSCMGAGVRRVAGV